jgi:two-component system CheB/CheR fusion protein
VLTSLRGGVVVIDSELRVVAWNTQSTELWGIRMEEAVDRNFFNLDIGLPVDALWQPVRRCLSGESTGEDVVVEATNRRGRPVTCQVTCLPLRGERAPRGVIVVTEPIAAAEIAP